jgi:hypothetical protein
MPQQFNEQKNSFKSTVINIVAFSLTCLDSPACDTKNTRDTTANIAMIKVTTTLGMTLLSLICENSCKGLQ